MSAENTLSLAEALGFSDQDLAENRAGRMSDAQKQHLRRGWRRTLWIVGALVPAFGLLATILLFMAQRNGSSILSVIGVLVTLINAVIVGLGAQSYLRTSGDINQGNVAELSGVVNHTIRVSGRVLTYVLKIEGQEVIVPKPVFLAFEDNKPYRLYRAPASKILLAAEAL